MNLILHINQPEKLFTSSDVATLKKEYRALALKYHPDHNKSSEASSVFEHINSLYQTALLKTKMGLWEGSGCLHLNNKDIPYYKMKPTHIVTTYFCEESVVYLFKKEHRFLFEQAKKMIQKAALTITKKVSQEFEKYLPKDVEFIDIPKGDFAIKIPKRKTAYSLKEILDYFGGELDPRHVAWILSSLYNINCFLEHQNIVHLDLSLENYFIDPTDHSGYLLGGFWFATSKGEKLKAVPKRTYEVVPHLCKNPTNQISRELIRHIGRELLNNPRWVKSKTTSAPRIPPALANWLSGTSTTASAIEEFTKWDDCLLKSFGKRRFMEMIVDHSKLLKG